MFKMSSLMLSTIIILIISSTLVVIWNSKFSLINLMISLEMLSIAFIFGFWFWFSLNENFFSLMLFLSMIACESSLGLSLIVSLSREKGNTTFLQTSTIF